MKHLFTLLSILLICSSIEAQNSLNFDGSDDYVQTTFPSITGNSARTIEAWIKTTANANPSAGGSQKVITDMGTFVTGSRFTFNILWGNALRVEVGGSGFSGKTAVNDGNWHHVACVYDPNATDKISLYVDGSLDTAGNITTSVTTIASNMVIGRRVDNTNYWDGNIDEVRVWNFAKTAAQLASLYQQEICQNQTGLVAYYRLNEGTANGNNSAINTANDFSSNTYTGTLTNFGLLGSTSNWTNGVSITPAPDTTINIDTTVCGGFLSPQGNAAYTSRIVTDVYTNVQGCDSLLRYNVTVNTNKLTFETQQACDSFRTIKGILKTQSEIYTEVYTLANGCDSTVQTILTINQSTRDTLNISTCYAYTSPSAKIWSTTGVYLDTLQTAAGCDSLFTINLNINDTTYATVYDTSCSQYIGPSNITYNTTGTYTEVIANANGCDSVITLNLVINNPSDTVLTAIDCDSTTSESGRNTWYTSGNYFENFIGANGCDSIVNYEVGINFATSETIAVNECGPFTSPAGNLITKSGIYTDILINTTGCDSVLTIEATITENSPVVSKDGETLEVDIVGLTYQWLNCDNNNSRIALANKISYTPTMSGNYAVEVTEDNCKDTSVCINYPRTAAIEDIVVSDISLAPNPANNSVKIKSVIDYDFVLINNLGQNVYEGNTANTLSTSQLPEGVYYIRILTKDKTITLPLVVEHTK